MQHYSDPYLGWTESVEYGQDYFFRQLSDVKIELNVELFDKNEMHHFADQCGQALALSHARSDDAALLSGYMGQSDVFDMAIAQFSVAFANQYEKDYAAFKRAFKSGKIEAQFEEQPYRVGSV